MQIAPLHLSHLDAWAGLLAAAFDRQTADMCRFLHYLHAMYPVVAWGAWDGERLAAQYSCLLVRLQLPGLPASTLAGMSINMAVHPDYRGQGLVKLVAKPVYEEVIRQGGVAGVGFSNAAGVKVDRRSKGYGYQVVGRMQSTAVYLGKSRARINADECKFYLTTVWPDNLPEIGEVSSSNRRGQTPQIYFHHTLTSLKHRFACHPFRHYAFGVWEGHGVVVYRPVRFGPVSAVSLLAVYGDDVFELLRGWITAMREQGIRWVHLLSSPTSSVLEVLQKTAVCLPLPFSRNPYYLTVKPLSPDMPQMLLNYGRWDCLGGDIL